jgi:uncharacterized protein with von Willebrand factor type A (vWA) domain
VLLLLDIGGSMDPHAEACSRLFSAAKRATHFRELKIGYFHNCIYGQIYKTARLDTGEEIPDVLSVCDAAWKLIIVGDAAMHPSELTASSGTWTWGDYSGVPGVAWLHVLRNHFRKSAWINPEPEMSWSRGTMGTIRKIFPMYRLTLDGLVEAMGHLTKGGNKL